MSILPGRLGPIGGGRLRGGILSAASALPADYDTWRQGISFNSACVDTSGNRLWYCTDPDSSPCVNEVQTLTITGAGGGSFQLTLIAQTTAPISYGSTAGSVQTTLDALSNVNPGDIVVTGGPDVYTFTFGGQYDCGNVPELVADCTALTAPALSPGAVDLFTAETYGVLAGSTITNVPTSPTLITGDLGLDPGSAVTGFPLGVVTGASNVNNPAAIQAKADLVTAYLDAAGRTTDFLLPPDIGGSTLSPGVYTTDGTPTSLAITGTVTLDAAGDPDAVWIFQIESTLITAPAAVVSLINGAQACNVFWQVGTSATLDTTTTFAGTILALDSITLNTGANVDGRVLARNAAVTFDDNDVTVPTCIPQAPVGCAMVTDVQGSGGLDAVADKLADNVGAPVTFEPFMVYSERDCSTWMPPDELEGLARIGLDRTLSQGVALQLQTNPLGTSSPSLNSVATDITPVVPTDVENTLSGLLSITCECGLPEIVLHAPLRSLPFLIERHLVEWDEGRGVWHMGPYTFSFDCYSETGPGGVDTAADGSEVWIYATGPVEWSIGPAEVVGRPESISVRTNDALSLIEHLSIVRFDTCCVYAARAIIF